MFPHERSLVNRMEGRPFAIIGVNSDPDKGTIPKQNEKHKITWRSFWCGPDGPEGPIPTKWNVNAWPTLYFIDHKGVIRHKNLRNEHEMDKAIETLVAEAEKDLGLPPPKKADKQGSDTPEAD